MILNKLADATFIALETFRENGEGVTTPVWAAGEDGKLYVWTEKDSWKVKRIRNNGHVRISESDGRGNPKGDWMEAQARIIDSEESKKLTKALFRSKYGFQFRVFSFMGGNRTRVTIEIAQS